MIDSMIAAIQSNVASLSIQREFKYEVDSNENRHHTNILKSVGQSPIITPYFPDNQDRYKSVGNTEFVYDRNGNLLKDVTNSYRFDAYNRVSEINTSSGKVKIFYDPLGCQVSIESGGVIREFVYSGPRPIEWRDNGIVSGQVVPLERLHQYAHLATKGVDCNPIFDKMDSVLGWIQSNGDIISKTMYDPFGQVLEHQDNTDFGLNFGFAGYPYEEKSGTYRLPARSYNPDIGRFLQRDPSGIADGLNLYSYTHHSPGTLTDYWGLDSDYIDTSWANASL